MGCGPDAGEQGGEQGNAGKTSGPGGDAWSATEPRDVVDPPFARWDVVEGLRAGQEAPVHRADGGGRVWLESALSLGDSEPGAPVVAGTAGRWTFGFEAGELGIAEGGLILFRVSPYWRWSQPWCLPSGAEAGTVIDPMALAMQPGLTEVNWDAEGLALEVYAVKQGVVMLVGGRAMQAGEQVQVVYGAGAAGAHADDFAEQGAPFWFAVDGDGDGFPHLLAEPARTDVVAGPPAQLVAILTSCLAPGEQGRLTVAVLESVGSVARSFEGSIRLVDSHPSLGLPDALMFAAADEGSRTIELRPQDEGVFRVIAEGPDKLAALSNPLVVLEGLEGVLWADLHGHSQISDGTGTPADYYAYARDVAALDVVALTDHDHWGERKLDTDPETWELIRDTVREFHDPGRFVALLGYEWTSWIHGHRHVLGFDEDLSLRVLSSMDPDYETPRQLWDALAGQPVLTFAHHSAGGPIATNWTFHPDPILEPVTEIVSVHGVSEALDAEHAIYSPRPGNFVRDVLDEGMRFGFIGSGDSHDGHPGLPQLSNPSGVGGLAAILTDDATREGVLTAMRQRRVYATSGARIVLRCSLDGHRMGSALSADEAQGELALLVYGTAPLRAVDLIRSGEVVETVIPEGELVFDFAMSWDLTDLEPGEYLYVRVLQADGEQAWSSPFYVE
jgi:hypothetical protein